MLKIIQEIANVSDKETVLDYAIIEKAVQNAIVAIKNELPKETQTIEVMEYVISEISDALKEKKVIL